MNHHMSSYINTCLISKCHKTNYTGHNSIENWERRSTSLAASPALRSINFTCREQRVNWLYGGQALVVTSGHKAYFYTLEYKWIMQNDNRCTVNDRKVCAFVHLTEREARGSEGGRGREREARGEGAGLQSESLRRADLSRRCGQTLEIPSFHLFSSCTSKIRLPSLRRWMENF